MKFLKRISLFSLCLLILMGCDAGEDVDTPGAEAAADDIELMEEVQDEQELEITEDNVMMEGMTITQIVTESEQFSILEQALNSAHLAAMLGSGSYTLIAPTNDAFEELDEGALESWLMTENRDRLSMILEYHVINEEVTAMDLADGFIYGSVLGSPLNFDVESDGEINVNDHEVEYVIHASNGVIYVMAEVLMPDDIDKDLADT